LHTCLIQHNICRYLNSNSCSNTEQIKVKAMGKVNDSMMLALVGADNAS